MKKHLFSVVMMLLAVVFGAQAQMPQLTPMPPMPGLRTGVLPNGLTYYVLHNEEPKGRANFYIAQKVGSTLENQDQLGLAHFLEHMAFNGSAHYPGKAMLTYLQNKGVRFGADINAYTSLDETVYRINNVDSKDVALMDSVLLVLRDWSCDLLLEDEEIEAERGVIQEEWRTPQDPALQRMWDVILPVIYEEPQYHQMPIGTMEVVMNFKPDALRAYYHKWYRPDQQGIIVVGDFDAEEMEKKVVALFSDIKMPESAAERVYPTVSDNEAPIYVEFEDPEQKTPRIDLSFKEDKIPFEMRNTQEMFINVDLCRDVLCGLINNRLEEYSKEADCDYMAASVYFGNFWVSKTKGAFNVVVIPKGNNAAEALHDAMSVIVRACKTGFTDSELERVDTEILSYYEKAYNERDKTNSHVLGQELTRLFVDNEPASGAEFNYQLVSAILPQIPVQAINMFASQILTPANQVMVLAQPKNNDFQLPGKDKMLGVVTETMNGDYEAYVDEVITEPLLATQPVAGKIVEEKTDAALGTTEFKLSNGMKVIVKPTDFSNDEILVKAWRDGGLDSYTAADAANLQMLPTAVDASRLGNFNVKTLNKYLSGKRLSLGVEVGMKTFNFNGSSSVKDLPTFFELLYANFAELNPDAEMFEVERGKMIKNLEITEGTPQYVWQKKMSATVYGNNPLLSVPSVATVKAADYDAILKMVKAQTATPAAYEMILVGNVDLAALRPLLEQYVASIPTMADGRDGKSLQSIGLATGEVADIYDINMPNPNVQVMNYLVSENVEYTMKNDVLYDLFGDIVDNNFTMTLREEEGGTYSPQAGAFLYPASKQAALYYIFMTNNEMGERLQKRAIEEVKNIIANGTNAEEFNKVREAAVTQLGLALNKNGYWLGQLYNLERGYDMMTGRMDYLKSLTLEDLNAFMKGAWNGQNRIQIVQNGVKAE
ncbi:MAG: insulinase family protein [Bacteroides sp.]|nr:insulinase family protein [Bacteroides sp.]